MPTLGRQQVKSNYNRSDGRYLHGSKKSISDSTIEILIQKISRNETSVTSLLPMKRIIYKQTNPKGLKRFDQFFHCWWKKQL
jgi:hypothetical protein